MTIIKIARILDTKLTLGFLPVFNCKNIARNLEYLNDFAMCKLQIFSLIMSVKIQPVAGLCSLLSKCIFIKPSH